MTLLLILLAIPGVLAVLLRLSTALLRAAKYSVERYVARQIKDQRGERGDLSGMAEAETVRDQAAQRQRRFVGESLVWIGLLALPALFAPAVFAYPFYSIFWLLPARSRERDGS